MFLNVLFCWFIFFYLGKIIQSQAYNLFQRSMGKYIHETNPKVNRLINRSKTQVWGFWTRGMEATFEQSKPAKFDDADLICLLAWNTFLCSFPFICTKSLENLISCCPFLLGNLLNVYYSYNNICHISYISTIYFDRFICIYFKPSSTG